jgi:hypothetical protein
MDIIVAGDRRTEQRGSRRRRPDNYGSWARPGSTVGARVSMLPLMTRKLVIALFASATLAGCGWGGGGGGAASQQQQPPPKVPGIAGLQRAVGAARGAVATSVQDAQRASGTDAGQ